MTAPKRDKPETPSVMIMKTAAKPMDLRTDAKWYTLRTPDESFVNIDGSGFTAQKEYRYRGTLEQARTMRKRFVECAIIPFN